MAHPFSFQKWFLMKLSFKELEEFTRMSRIFAIATKPSLNDLSHYYILPGIQKIPHRVCQHNLNTSLFWETMLFLPKCSIDVHGRLTFFKTIMERLYGLLTAWPLICFPKETTYNWVNVLKIPRSVNERDYFIGNKSTESVHNLINFMLQLR